MLEHLHLPLKVAGNLFVLLKFAPGFVQVGSGGLELLVEVIDLDVVTVDQLFVHLSQLILTLLDCFVLLLDQSELLRLGLDLFMGLF